LRSFDHRQLDSAAEIIVRTAQHSGAEVCGPIPLPISKTRYDLLRSPHVDKDSREQIEIRTYHRLIDIRNPSRKTAEAFNELQIPVGVTFNMKEMQWTA
jgi:small subunit ribosomal protein S10